jgi:uncharacterized membrane protein YoaK (UPF0700 family)
VNVSGSRWVPALLFVLSVIAGCTDVIGFLGLNGLFTSHITGNLVILAAHVVAGDRAEIARLLAVPVFAVVVSLAIVLAGGLEARGIASLRPLLLLQAVLLGGFLAVSVAAGRGIDPNAASGIFAGMLGVSAMAVQHALVQYSLKGAPVTAVMTSDITRFAIDVGELMRRGDPAKVAEVRTRAVRAMPPIVGFILGCAIGAACEVSFGLTSLAVPAGLALFALAMGLAAESDGSGNPPARKARVDVISPSAGR